MLTSIGKKPERTGLVSALLDCHERIRRFSGLARRLAEAEGAPEADVRELASHIHRYFQIGLPAHVRDEEESILPRLRGRSRELDRALDTMAKEHAEHEARVEKLLELLSALMAAPARLPELAPELVPLAAAVEHDFATHLELEERVVFPALAALPPEVLAEIQREGHARRS
jgi:iron-sulfur cluster repair protein YtfE (RIC family)